MFIFGFSFKKKFGFMSPFNWSFMFDFCFLKFYDEVSDLILTSQSN